MKLINWDREKNQKLISYRGISFEDILFALENNKLVDDLPHPNNTNDPNQRIMMLDIRNYIYAIPYVENEKEIFLKTIIPSRKATKEYLGERDGK
ncbi:MAG: BrnT family toxin [Melioribacteraceae bacterium]|jgi:uncharacterized DUF497 family protein|nr:BrnT family toxin [Melioribacteraceae bacterium]